jgi:hypothetical protein
MPRAKSITKEHYKHLGIVIFIFLVSRLLFTAYYFTFANALYSDGSNAMLNLCYGNDCSFYMSIAKSWYQSCNKDIAFFPAVPYLINLIKMIIQYFSLDIPLILGIIVINQLFTLCSTILLYLYTCKNYNRNISLWTTIIFIFSTEQIYFFTAYTESMFILLILTLMMLLEKKHFFIASIISLILSITRANGCMAAIIILYEESKKKQKSYIMMFLNFIIAISGLLFFIFLLYKSCNDGLAFMHVQNEFGRKSLIEILNGNLQQFTRYFFRGNIVDKISFVLFIISSIYFIKTKRWKDFRILSFFMMPALMSLTIMAFTRFILALPPIYIFLGVLIDKLDSKLRIPVVAAIVITNALYFYLLLKHSSFIW